ncbi:hypothetical protein [Pseudonocardia nigra]|uniref:hypothetical protein n=1 Tax=Pseudonocardia nigra TaxID=1921578 RepID=UPI001C5E82ED|nr:hypothetical protein [Pseudonocardia nigra]
MNTNDNPRQHAGGEERSEAVAQAEAGATAWRAVVHAQRSAAPDHADFYALAAAVVETLQLMELLTAVLGAQVAGYGQGRALYDDEGGDPAVRLAEAVWHVSAIGQHLAVAEWSANRFWSAIGHVGVEVTR